MPYFSEAVKEFIRSYLSFSRRERIGIAGLLVILTLLILLRFTLSLWVKPATVQVSIPVAMPTPDTTKIPARTPVMPQERVANEDERPARRAPAGDIILSPLPSVVDINESDSAQLARAGINLPTVSCILAFKKENGRINELAAIVRYCRLDREEEQNLRQHSAVR